MQQVGAAIEEIDILLIDTAAGISSNVMDFNVSAREILVVVSPEPTSLTDAYALMKRIKALLDPHGLLNPGVILNDDANIGLAEPVVGITVRMNIT